MADGSRDERPERPPRVKAQLSRFETGFVDLGECPYARVHTVPFLSPVVTRWDTVVLWKCSGTCQLPHAAPVARVNFGWARIQLRMRSERRFRALLSVLQRECEAAGVAYERGWVGMVAFSAADEETIRTILKKIPVRMYYRETRTLPNVEAVVIPLQIRRRPQ